MVRLLSTLLNSFNQSILLEFIRTLWCTASASLKLNVRVLIYLRRVCRCRTVS